MFLELAKLAWSLYLISPARSRSAPATRTSVGVEERLAAATAMEPAAAIDPVSPKEPGPAREAASAFGGGAGAAALGGGGSGGGKELGSGGSLNRGLVLVLMLHGSGMGT